MIHAHGATRFKYYFHKEIKFDVSFSEFDVFGCKTLFSKSCANSKQGIQIFKTKFI
jgi:hypothetical protein